MADGTGVDWRTVGWMHLYAQPFQHAGAEIRGTRPALLALRAAIDAALSGGIGQSTAFATDGEGYGIKVQRIEVIGLLGPLPYTEEGWNEARHAAWSAAPRAHLGPDRVASALAEAFAAGVRHAAERRGEAPVTPDAEYDAAEAAVTSALDDVRAVLGPLCRAASLPTAALLPDGAEVAIPLATCRAAVGALGRRDD